MVGGADGVLGTDFLKKFAVKINYEDDTIELSCTQTSHMNKVQESLRVNGIDENIEMNISKPQDIEESLIYRHTNWTSLRKLTIIDNVTLGARTENIIYYPTDWKTDIVVEKMEVADGIYLGSTIETPENGFIKIAIINSREKDFVLNKSDINACITPLIDYYILNKIYCTENDEKRRTELIEAINLSHCNEEERDSVLKIILKYKNVFHLKGDRFTATNAGTHKIELIPGSTPVNCKEHRLPYYQREILDIELKKLVNDGIIRESISDWASPVLLVEKKQTQIMYANGD